MTKAGLVDKMAKDAKISKTAATKALSSFTDGVTKELKKKDSKVTLVDLDRLQKCVVKHVKAATHRQANLLKSRFVTS